METEETSSTGLPTVSLAENLYGLDDLSRLTDDEAEFWTLFVTEEMTQKELITLALIALKLAQ
jgi:hypothetical protein